MSYCLNPNCNQPQNPQKNKFCQYCGSKLLLRERYRALQQIGQGGFGKTFLAVDEDKPSKPPCVIKQFLPQAKGMKTLEKAAELFEQEAKRLDQLGQNNQIPELLAYFEYNGRLYLVQEFIDGQNLAEEIEIEGCFNETQIRQLLNSLLPVLEFVHNSKVIHRDIKPENIIRRREDKQLVLVDFGAAKFATGTALLKTGTVIGTPQYTAPEQALGKADFASDLYSLGVTCIHLLTHIDPFELFSTSDNEWAWRDYVNPPITTSLSRILEKMVQMATRYRYQTATEILEDLSHWLERKNKRTSTSTTTSTTSLRRVEIENKYGYINEKGQMAIALQFDGAREFTDYGLAAIEINNKWGYINRQGQQIIAPQFKGALDFAEGRAPVKIGKWLGIVTKWGYIDDKGEIVIEPQFNEAQNFVQGLALVRISDKWGYINPTGTLIIPPQFDRAFSFSQGLARVKTGSKWGYIDKTGKMVIAPRDDGRDFAENLAAVQINNKWGYLDRQGTFIIQPQFNKALDFAEGLAPVLMPIKLFRLIQTGQKWGYIDKTGLTIIEPKFEYTLGFSEGLAAVKILQKWGYINKVGQLVIKPQFDFAGNFTAGIAEVIIEEQYRYINRKGEFIY